MWLRVIPSPYDVPRPGRNAGPRPNPIALSAVRLLGVDGATLRVVGLDCLDGTPLLEIKPYFASVDSVPDAVVGWHKTPES